MSLSGIIRAILPVVLLCAATSAIAQSGQRFHIFFDKGDTVLRPPGKKTLDSLIAFRVIHAASRFAIYAHCGESAIPAADGKLANGRARAIDRYFRMRGFNSLRITTHWSDRADVDTTIRQINYIEVLPGPPPPPGAMSSAIDSTPVNGTFTLHNLLFVDGKDTFLPESLPVLQELAVELSGNRRIELRLEGHVCCGANDAAGMDLSRRRAAAVADFLIGKGISAARLQTAGFGFSRPLKFPERSQGDKKENRRVEARITSR